jgi:hypothetical protein
VQSAYVGCVVFVTVSDDADTPEVADSLSATVVDLTISTNTITSAGNTADNLRTANATINAGTLEYQWQRNSDEGAYVNITGATAQTYAPVEADIGFRLRVQITATNGIREVVEVSLPPTALVTIADANLVLSGTAGGSYVQGDGIDVNHAKSGAGAVSYGSGYTDVCTVDVDGVVTYVAAGSCVITATLAANGIYAGDTESVTFTLSEVEKNNPAPSIDSRTSAEALSVVLEVKVWNTPSIEMVPRNF